MVCTDETLERLFQLYLRHIDELRADVTRANTILGSPTPESRLRPLSRTDFEECLKNSERDPEVARAWIQQIIRGHELEFSHLEVA